MDSRLRYEVLSGGYAQGLKIGGRDEPPGQ
jgi:hypothetical protein